MAFFEDILNKGVEFVSDIFGGGSDSSDQLVNFGSDSDIMSTDTDFESDWSWGSVAKDVGNAALSFGSSAMKTAGSALGSPSAGARNSSGGSGVNINARSNPLDPTPKPATQRRNSVPPQVVDMAKRNPLYPYTSAFSGYNQ